MNAYLRVQLVEQFFYLLNFCQPSFYWLWFINNQLYLYTSEVISAILQILLWVLCSEIITPDNATVLSNATYFIWYNWVWLKWCILLHQNFLLVFRNMWKWVTRTDQELKWMENCSTMHRLSPGLTKALVLKRGNETGYRNKGRPRLCWIDNKNEVTWANTEVSIGLDKWPRTAEIFQLLRTPRFLHQCNFYLHYVVIHHYDGRSGIRVSWVIRDILTKVFHRRSNFLCIPM